MTLRTEGRVLLDSFCFEEGTELHQVELAYERVGKIGSPVILVCHALTGHHCAVGTEKERGWWSGLIGPQREINLNHFCVITFNVLGGCNGSTGPASINPATDQPYRQSFPTVTIRDMVHSQKRALEKLGIEKVEAVIGGSLGGMQALEWGLLYPTFMKKVVVLAATPYLSDYGIAFNTIGAVAIQNDPHWQNGNYESSAEIKGFETARMAGMVTYRSRELFNEKFNRRKGKQHDFEIQSYLEYQGKKLAKRFDANSYLALIAAMNSHDIGKGRKGWQQAAKHYQCELCLIAFQGDLLYPSEELEQLHDQLIQSTYHYVKTDFGHDGFLVEFQQWAHLLSAFLLKENTV
ncbi:homoserine O-acetyltransferase MetX [Bacillus sp. 2205SS5-2]|uniref:homoserine O-acetyltransferase MetX n=1 Tax=Bacillus sp. 2205SS5-2 TaxID=3109031 RepID=UPI0030079505